MELKKLHRGLIKMSRWIALNKKWGCIISAINNNGNKVFWPINNAAINPPSKIPLCTVHLTYENYFKKLFTDANAGTPNTSFIIPLDVIASWSEVSVLDIICLIKGLKLEKAPGSDLIPNKVFKAELQWCATVLAPIFTLINTSGQIPN